MSKQTYPITGIQDGRRPDGSVPLRLEINKFVDPSQNPYAVDQINIFLIALQRIQNASREELLSWFQISGIHGEPYAVWDNSQITEEPSDTQWAGYCTHASILFPTWHRVYETLVEQAVHKYIKEVVAQYPAAEQQRLKPAVDHWRLPYWDWALVHDGPDGRKLRVPELLKLEKVSVRPPNANTPTGVVEIPNPLYRYGFPLNSSGTIDGITDTQISDTLAVPTSKTPFTVRHPKPYDPNVDFQSQTTWSQGISDNQAVEDALNQGLGTRPSFGRQLVADTYALFAKMRSYPPFSNTQWRGDGSVPNYLSLEGLHNTIHIWCGGMTFGHMSLNETAAFDPIFWFHHGNVERLLSIFQALNPADHRNWPNDAWISGTVEPWFTDVEQPNSGGGTATTPAGQNETTTTPLTPFHRDTAATVWNSDNARKIIDLGYGFEELQHWLPKYNVGGRFNEPLFCADVRKSLVEKYGWAVPSPRRLGRISRLGPQRSIAGAAKAAVENVAQGTLSTTPLEHHFNEYVVNVRVDRFAIKGHSFVVHVFLGGVPDNTYSWETAETQIGVVAVFGGGRLVKGTCGNCKAQAGDENARLLTGQLSITSTLLDAIENGEQIGGLGLTSLEKDEVSPFLKKNLHWRVSTLGATEYDIKDIPSLRVSVAVGKAIIPDDENDLIRYTDFEVLDEPTHGRLGGFNAIREAF